MKKKALFFIALHLFFVMNSPFSSVTYFQESQSFFQKISYQPILLPGIKLKVLLQFLYFRTAYPHKRIPMNLMYAFYLNTYSLVEYYAIYPILRSTYMIILLVLCIRGFKSYKQLISYFILSLAGTLPLIYFVQYSSMLLSDIPNTFFFLFLIPSGFCLSYLNTKRYYYTFSNETLSILSFLQP